MNDPDSEDCNVGSADTRDEVYYGQPDSTPWCLGCGAMTEAGCDCGPIADNQ